MVTCSLNKPCVGWVEASFKDCLCSLDDEISFSLGLVSLVFWAVAEIPQIVTNFYSKSCSGVSLAFLLTWVVGDVFNLVGCVLEPATLPTQYYTALLYTIVTVILVLQIIYYDYILRWWKNRRLQLQPVVDEDNKNSSKHVPSDAKITMPTATAPVRVSLSMADKYYTSARSLARSGTPPFGSYLGVAAKSGPSVLSRPDDNSSSEEEESPIYSRKPLPKPKFLSRSVDYGAFIAAAVNLPFQSNAFIEGQTILSGRRFLQDHQLKTNTYGMWLGWMMAAIYMGGRIPQIWLNIKRGSVEGLNPLMFVLALLANATYVGSILVRSVEWERIKANAPWLLDAIVCVALDLFIILQFAYYKSRQRRMSRCRNDNENVLFEAEKALLS